MGLLILAAFLPSAAAAAQTSDVAPGDESPSFEAEAVPGQVIVKFEEDATSAEEADARRDEGLLKEDELELIDAEVAEVEGQSVEQAVRDLERRPDVEYAEPDYIRRPTGYADEPRFGELWGLNNTGQSVQGSTGSPDVDLNGSEASAVTQGDPNLVVAVIDDGVDFTHPDLAGRKWVNPGESGGGKEGNGRDDDVNGYVDDVNGWDFVNNDNMVHNSPNDTHGTHVAGTIAASINGGGVVGVAPNVKIMALNFLGSGPNRGSISSEIKAIQYATKMGVRISNNSYGGIEFSQAEKDAIDASGQLFVAAAGNAGVNSDGPAGADYPAAYDSRNILSVAAINNKGDLADFSNYGATSVDISAPGVNILSTLPGKSYGYKNGTSMASPHATGAAALAASAKPALLGNPAGLKQAIMDSGKPAPSTAGKTVTGKMVDAKAAAVAAGDEEPPAGEEPPGGEDPPAEEPPDNEEPVEPGRGCTIRGTDGDDILEGTPGRDVICGRKGNDTIDGGASDDVIRGGRGADVIAGGEGDDLLRGKRGDDDLDGGEGADTVKGGRGNDECVIDPGDEETKSCRQVGS